MAKRVRSRKEENRDDRKDATEREKREKREKGGTAAETKAAPKTAPDGVKKKRANEIDDLFSSLGATKNTPKKTPSSASAGGTTHSKDGREVSKETAAGSKKSSSKGRLVGSKDDIFGTGDVGGRKTTEEGYKIYSEEELGLGVSNKNAGYSKDWWVPTSTAVRSPRLSLSLTRATHRSPVHSTVSVAFDRHRPLASVLLFLSSLFFRGIVVVVPQPRVVQAVPRRGPVRRVKIEHGEQEALEELGLRRGLWIVDRGSWSSVAVRSNESSTNLSRSATQKIVARRIVVYELSLIQHMDSDISFPHCHDPSFEIPESKRTSSRGKSYLSTSTSFSGQYLSRSMRRSAPSRLKNSFEFFPDRHTELGMSPKSSIICAR